MISFPSDKPFQIEFNYPEQIYTKTIQAVCIIGQKEFNSMCMMKYQSPFIPRDTQKRGGFLKYVSLKVFHNREEKTWPTPPAVPAQPGRENKPKWDRKEFYQSHQEKTSKSESCSRALQHSRWGILQRLTAGSAAQRLMCKYCRHFLCDAKLQHAFNKNCNCRFWDPNKKQIHKPGDFIEPVTEREKERDWGGKKKERWQRWSRFCCVDLQKPWQGSWQC